MKIYANKIGKLRDGKSGKKYVFCKKSSPEHGFLCGKWYCLSGLYGDTNSSHESGEKYISSDFFNYFVILNYDVVEYLFEWEGKNKDFADVSKFGNGRKIVGNFQDYFAIDLQEERKLKLKELDKW